MPRRLFWNKKWKGTFVKVQSLAQLLCQPCVSDKQPARTAHPGLVLVEEVVRGGRGDCFVCLFRLFISRYSLYLEGRTTSANLPEISSADVRCLRPEFLRIPGQFSSCFLSNSPLKGADSESG